MASRSVVTSAMAGAPGGIQVPSLKTNTANATKSAEKTMGAALAAAQAQAASNQALAGQLVGTATNQSLDAARSFDAYIQSRFDASMAKLGGDEWQKDIFGRAKESMVETEAIAKTYVEDIMPGLTKQGQELIDQAGTRASEMLTGAIPDDVAARVRQITSESSNAGGLFGQAAQALTARDLGTTSVDIIGRGVSAATEVSNLRTAFQQQVGFGLEMANTKMKNAVTYSALMKSMTPEFTNPAALFDPIYRSTLAASIVDPSSVLNGHLAAMKMSLDVQADHAKLALQANIFNKELEVAKWSTGMQLKQQEAAKKEQDAQLAAAERTREKDRKADLEWRIESQIKEAELATAKQRFMTDANWNNLKGQKLRDYL